MNGQFFGPITTYVHHFSSEHSLTPSFIRVDLVSTVSLREGSANHSTSARGVEHLANKNKLDKVQFSFEFHTLNSQPSSNIVNLVYLPATFITVHITKKIGIKKTVRHQHNYTFPKSDTVTIDYSWWYLAPTRQLDQGGLDLSKAVPKWQICNPHACPNLCCFCTRMLPDHNCQVF
jgi:hypothetical protein